MLCSDPGCQGLSRFVAVTPEPFVTRLRVRYIECDMQGHVFNSHYYTWMDLSHTELIREVLGPLDVLHSLGADVVVAESSAPVALPMDTSLSAVEQAERVRIVEALDACAGNQTRAAKLLGVSRATLVTKISIYRIPRPRKK